MVTKNYRETKNEKFGMVRETQRQTDRQKERNKKRGKKTKERNRKSERVSYTSEVYIVFTFSKITNIFEFLKCFVLT